MKGQVLHRARAHLKVPGWSLVWKELLTKKLPMFLSRLNEMSGGCEKIVPDSGSIKLVQCNCSLAIQTIFVFVAQITFLRATSFNHALGFWSSQECSHFEPINGTE